MWFHNNSIKLTWTHFQNRQKKQVYFLLFIPRFKTQIHFAAERDSSCICQTVWALFVVERNTVEVKLYQGNVFRQFARLSRVRWDKCRSLRLHTASVVEVQTLTMACRELTKQDVGSASFWCFHFFVCTRACVTVCACKFSYECVCWWEMCEEES